MFASTCRDHWSKSRRSNSTPRVRVSRLASVKNAAVISGALDVVERQMRADEEIVVQRHGLAPGKRPTATLVIIPFGQQAEIGCRTKDGIKRVFAPHHRGHVFIFPKDAD